MARAWDEKGKPAGPAYTQRLADLKAATKRIGDSPIDRFRWIVWFSQQSLDSWKHSAASTDVGDALIAFSGEGAPDNFMGGTQLPAPMDGKEVARIHNGVSALLNDAVGSGVLHAFSLPRPAEEALIRVTKVGEWPAVFGLVYLGTDRRLAVLHRVKALLLSEPGSSLVACRNCKRPFVREGKRKYCGLDCGETKRNSDKQDRREAKRSQVTAKRRGK